MDPLSWLYLGIIILSVCLCAFFSSTETSFACINQFKLRVEADDGNKTAKLILKRYEKFDRTLTMSLLGYNMCSVVISSLAAFLFFKIFEKSGLDNTIISIISSVVMAFIVYIFSDMVPKMIARAMPNSVARNNVYIMQVFLIILHPLIMLFSLAAKLVNHLFRTGEQFALTEEDFTNVVDELEEKEVIEDNESDIIYASLEFTDTSVKEVFTPRNKIKYLDIKSMSKEQVKEAVLNIPFTRIPVAYGDLDKLVGVLHVKTFIREYLHNPNVQVKEIVQQPFYVSPSIKMDDMLEGFKKHHTHMAIVKYDGHVVGLITMEDVLEELVGKIAEPTLTEEKK